MFKSTIDVSSRDTDALGHVNNTSLPLWFEVARNPFYKIFNPDMQLDSRKWNLIMVHLDVDYLDQIYYGNTVEIRTYVSHIGNTSVTVYQEAWQNNKKKSTGKVVLVYFDFNKQKSMKIPDNLRKELKKHYIDK